jgi:cytochrome c-type biogenesis protein CcmE
MNQRRSKIIAASLILTAAMAFLVIAGVKNTSLRHFTPDELIAHAQEVDNKGVQIDGLIAEGTTQWDAAKFELTFAVREREGKAAVNVIYANKLRPDNFKDGGNVFVEGKYDTKRNLIVASKLQTKCASKYEAAEGVTARTGGVEKSDY